MPASVLLEPPVDHQSPDVPGHWPPPGDGGDGGGGGGGGGGGDDGGGGWEEHRSGPPLSLEKLGLLVLIASLSMLFAGMLAGYVVYRTSSPVWPPKGFPPLPRGLWLSTAIIVASSASLVWASRSLRAGAAAAVRQGLGWTAVLAMAFLLVQAWLWGESIQAGMRQHHIYGAMFFVATGAHALHVLGGVAVLVHAWARARRLADPTPLRQRVELAGLYWHFVGVLWLVLFGVLYLAE